MGSSRDDLGQRWLDGWTLLEAYYEKDHPRPVAVHYYRTLMGKHGASIEAWEYACQMATERCKWFPRIPVMVGLIHEYEEQQRWQQVRERVLAEHEQELKRLTRQARRALPRGASAEEVYNNTRTDDLIDDMEEDDG